jgi:small subunit ribosomal protein S14
MQFPRQWRIVKSFAFANLFGKAQILRERRSKIRGLEDYRIGKSSQFSNFQIFKFSIEFMATTAQLAKSKRKPKFSTRGVNRCQRCGRTNSYYQDFGLCRICLREMAHKGHLPGVTKASW